MKSDRDYFIDNIREALDEERGVADERFFEGAQQFLIENPKDYTGPNAVVSIKAPGDGMVRLDVFTETKCAKQKLILMEDNLNIDQTLMSLHEMIEDVMSEDEPEDESTDYSEKMSFDDIYAGPKEDDSEDEEDFEDDGEDLYADGKVPCKAYLEDDGTVTLVFNDLHNDKDSSLVCYAHEGGHSSCDPYYLDDECEELDGHDSRVKELVDEYEKYYSTEQDGEIVLRVLPIHVMLPNQKKVHINIESRD